MKILWVLFELKSLFLDFGRMEKMVGLSSDRWWYEDGGIVYPKKKKMVDLSSDQWWYEDGGIVYQKNNRRRRRRRRRRWWYEDRGVIWFPLMKRVVASSIKRCAGVMLL